MQFLFWGLCLLLRDGQALQRCFSLLYGAALWASASELRSWIQQLSPLVLSNKTVGKDERENGF